MKLGWIGAVALAAMPGLAGAAPGDWVKQVQPVAAPDQAGAVALPVGASALMRPPAPEGWARQDAHQRFVYNVAQPSLVPWAGTVPSDAVAPAVILVPGGGFAFLAMDNEGFDVARRLDRLGVRVFILKYRTLPIAGGFNGLIATLGQIFVKGAPQADIERDLPDAVADTQAAIRMVRSHAAAWHVDPARVGILGFSAGAITTLGTLQANAADARPDFAGMIYGPTATAPVPANAPPLFAAIAADDRFFGHQDLGLIDGWRKAGGSVEFHLFSAGGHGFASQHTGTTSDAWFDDYALWLKAQKIAL